MLPCGSPPRAIVQIVEKLKNEGCAAYIVGGALRDAMLAGTWQVVADWDLATSARPEKVMELFPEHVPVGIEHGTVKILVENFAAEVTTFRVEGEYRDHRRPEKVTFTSQIEEDLKRRDFTIGAMAYDPIAQVLLDPFGGQRDLALRLVRAVGDPKERLREDHLRLLRAVRFASTLGFQLEENLFQAIYQERRGIRTLSQERVSAELVKILRGPDPARGFRLLKKLGLLQEVLPELVEGLDLRLEVMAELPPSLHLRLAALLNGMDSNLAKQILRRLCLPRKVGEKVLLIVSWQGKKPQDTELDLRKFLAQVGKEAALDLVALWRSEARARGKYGQECEEKLSQIVQLTYKKLPLQIADLAVNGRDVMEILGIGPGPEVGEVLEQLLEQVILCPELNEKTTLEKILKLEEE